MSILFHIILAISLFASGKENVPTETVYPFQFGDNTINLIITEFEGTRNLVMINLHDNERTSINAGKKVLSEKGGILIRIDNQNTRLISFMLDDKKYTFDPNRMFTRPGVEASLKLNSQSTPQAIDIVSRFADSLLSKIPQNTEKIIALHNNDASPGLSIHSYSPGGAYEKEATQVYVNFEKDPDDFFLSTTHPHFLKVVTHGYNAILQNNKDVTDDGSLSVYMGLRNRAYINVEAEHGHEEEQTKMLQHLLKE
ncbi:MAG: hypothetical protein H0V30_04005 [Chitinophagaceae bacterium]|nr:hypothetical protein [Chitinophagaceae bacterium]